MHMAPEANISQIRQMMEKNPKAYVNAQCDRMKATWSEIQEALRTFAGTQKRDVATIEQELKSIRKRKNMTQQKFRGDLYRIVSRLRYDEAEAGGKLLVDVRDRLVCDRFVHGQDNEELMKYLIPRKHEKNSEKLMNLAVRWEQSQRDLKDSGFSNGLQGRQSGERRTTVRTPNEHRAAMEAPARWQPIPAKGDTLFRQERTNTAYAVLDEDPNEMEHMFSTVLHLAESEEFIADEQGDEGDDEEDFENVAQAYVFDSITPQFPPKRVTVTQDGRGETQLNAIEGEHRFNYILKRAVMRNKWQTTKMEKPRTLQALTYQTEVTHLCPLKAKIRNELISFNALILEKDAPDYGPELILGGRMTRLIKDIPPQRGATPSRGSFQNRGEFRGRGNGFSRGNGLRGRGNGQNKRWPPAPGKRFGRVTVPSEQNRQVNAAYECDYEAYESEQYDDEEDNPDVCVLQEADSTFHAAQHYIQNKKRFEERKQKYAQYIAAESESDSIDAEDGSPNPKRTATRNGAEFEPREESDSEADENHTDHRSRSRRRTPSAHQHRASFETDFAPPSTTTSAPTTIPLEIIAPVTETRHSGASDGATQKTTSSADSMTARPGSVIQVQARPSIDIVQRGKRGIDYEIERASCDKLHTIRSQSNPSREENQLLADRAQQEDWPVAFLGSKWIELRASRTIVPLERQALSKATIVVPTVTQYRICWVNPLQPREAHCTLYKETRQQIIQQSASGSIPHDSVDINTEQAHNTDTVTRPSTCSEHGTSANACAVYNQKDHSRTRASMERIQQRA